MKTTSGCFETYEKSAAQQWLHLTRLPGRVLHGLDLAGLAAPALAGRPDARLAGGQPCSTVAHTW